MVIRKSNRCHLNAQRLASIAAYLCAASVVCAAPFATLDPAVSRTGYLARLLINEAPFPGEHGYVSVANTKATMSQILWVLESRVHHVPPGYQQVELTAVKTTDIFDAITAGGVRGQCDGFYRDEKGRLASVPRVEERIQYLLKIANSGGKPGKFAGLINYSQELARAYMRGGITEADRFANLEKVDTTQVTGRAYSWMTDRDYYNPGGSFIKIPNAQSGSLGGNRFFTLKERQ
jgi:hypothetical protein